MIHDSATTNKRKRSLLNVLLYGVVLVRDAVRVVRACASMLCQYTLRSSEHSKITSCSFYNRSRFAEAISLTPHALA